MGKNLDSKCKQCRRSGEKLFLKGERCASVKCALIKRNYPPGFHGSKGRNRPTDYGQQLNEKQKAKKQYNLNEGQFRILFEKAKKTKANTNEVFLQILEKRLDNTIFRAGFASSRPQARQMVNHGFFTINGKKVNIPSYQVKTGDVIKINSTKKNSKNLKNIGELMKKNALPGWLNYNPEEGSIKVLNNPNPKEIRTNFNVQIITEFYSR